MSYLRRRPEERAETGRLDRVGVVLTAMATETVAARQEVVRLRLENNQLARRVAELESASALVVRSKRSERHA
jgi:hypothetical protein